MKIKLSNVRFRSRKRYLLIAMRIIVFLMCTTVFCLNTENSFSQEKILIKKDQLVTVDYVFKIIKKQTNFNFIYNKGLFKNSPKIQLKKGEIKASDLLNQALLDKPFIFELTENKTIIFKENPYAKAANITQQKTPISGIIKDENGVPIPGVNIIIQGTSIGTQTDFDGAYRINAKKGDVLLFTFIGYKSQKITVGDTFTIDLTLAEQTSALEEVIVVGYGSIKKSEITGSVSTVKVENLVGQPTADLDGMLKGAVPGLYVTSGNVRPGATSNLVLRGESSLKGGNAPLYVIDGIPVDNIQDLNISDVESISVLKDASAQGIYGSRASNGVILITTKRGKNTNGKVNVSYSGYVSFQNMNPNFRVFDGDEYLAVRREGARADNANAANNWVGEYQPDENIFSDFELELIENKNYSNWYQYAFKKHVPLIKHDISLYGGDEKTQYKASLGYFDQEGMRPDSGYERFTANLSIDKNISDTFKSGFSAYLTKSKQQSESADYVDFITYTPLAKIVDEQGELVRYPLGDTKLINPLLYNESNEEFNNAYRGLFSGYIEVTPQFLKGFSYKLNVNADMRFTEKNEFNSFKDPDAEGIGYARVDNTSTINYLVENIINYNNTFFGNHKLNVTLMQGWQENNYHRTSAIGNQLGNDFFGINSLGSSVETEVQRIASLRTLLSYMGRVNYVVNDKYLFNFTVRRDGSSVFGANNKWGVFPSASVGWNINNENFMNQLSWINQAKIRLSYGQIGNQAISSYGSLATADNSFYVSGSTPVVGYLPGSTFANPNLKWETTTTLNASFDFSLFKNRLFGTFEYYDKVTTDLLVDRNLPSLSGYTKMPDNLGEVNNKGIELALTGYMVSTPDLSWSLTAIFSKNKNTLTKGVLQDDTTGEFIDDEANNWYIGQSINSSRQYVFDGIWQIDDDFTQYDDPLLPATTRPGDIRVKDLNGDGLITEDGDRRFITDDPDWMGSINTRLKYKNFEFSMDVYTVQGVEKYNQFLGNQNYGGSLGLFSNGVKIDYWTPENPINNGYRPNYSVASEYRGTFAIRDASYIRIRNITMAYNLPESVMKETKVRLYVALDNPWTKTDWIGYSPEGTASSYPETKNFTVGMNVNF